MNRKTDLRVLKSLTLGALGFATVFWPLFVGLPAILSPCEDRYLCGYGLGIFAKVLLLVWLILLPIVWFEYLTARKPGKGPAGVERSYWLIIIVVAVFELLPMVVAALHSM